MPKAARHLATLIGLVVLCCFSTEVLARESPKLELGSRVRVTVTEPSTKGDGTSTIVGWLYAVGLTTITVQSIAFTNPIELPRDHIEEFEMSTSGSRGKGAIIGLVIGAAAGVTIGLAAGDQKNCHFAAPCYTAEETAVLAAVVLGSLGMLAGFAGSGQKWKTIPSDQFYLGFDHSGGGVQRLSLTLRF